MIRPIATAATLAVLALFALAGGVRAQECRDGKCPKTAEPAKAGTPSIAVPEVAHPLIDLSRHVAHDRPVRRAAIEAVRRRRPHLFGQRCHCPGCHCRRR
jgi:hypothetical protein